MAIRVGVIGVVLLAATILASNAAASSWRGQSVDWGERAAQYPAVGGDPLGNLRLGELGGKLIGVNGDFAAPAGANATLEKIASGGVRATRRMLSWTSHESAPTQSQNPNWNEAAWSQSRAFYDAALANGVRPMFVISFSAQYASSGCLPPAVSQQCNRPPDAKYDWAWQRFATKAANEFPEADFEIWNEPNTDHFWGDAPINPERWASLASLASDAIEAVDADIRVLGCGCVGISEPNSSTMPFDDFLRRAYAAPASIKGKLDGLSFHFYPQGFQPFAPLEFGAGSHFARLVHEVRSVSAQAGESGVPLWIDEVGYWTLDSEAPQYAVTEEEAAAGHAELARVALTMPDIKALFIHREVDGPAGTGRDRSRQSSFGLLYRGDRAGKPALGAKPAFCQLAAMAGVYRHDDPACPLLIAPETSITTAPPTADAPPDVSFAFSSGGGALFECSLDGEAPRRCSSPASYELLEPGAHSFAVRAYRLDGTEDATREVRDFVVDADATAPAARIDSRPPLLSFSREARFTFSASVPNSSFQCSFDGSPFENCSSPVTYTDLSHSNHRFEVRAFRLAGHPGPVDAAQFSVVPLTPMASTTATVATTTTTTPVPTSTQTTTTPATISTSPTTTTTTTTSPAATSGSSAAAPLATTTTAGPATKPPPRRDPKPLTPPAGGMCDIVGTAGDDVLIGTRERETICGRGGNDVIRGRDGDDTIFGGKGHDVIMGGDGADRIRGNDGRDRLMGGFGRDAIWGGRGNDRLTGGPGRDRLRGGPGRDRKRR